MAIEGGQITLETTKEAIKESNANAFNALTARGIMWKDGENTAITETEWLANSVGGFKAGTVVSDKT